jgi:hypothetical protein
MGFMLSDLCTTWFNVNFATKHFEFHGRKAAVLPSLATVAVMLSEEESKVLFAMLSGPVEGGQNGSNKLT